MAKQDWQAPEWWEKIPEDLKETIKENMLFHSDYTRKSQEMVDERKQFETQLAEIRTSNEGYRNANNKWGVFDDRFNKRFIPQIQKLLTDEQLTALDAALHQEVWDDTNFPGNANPNPPNEQPNGALIKQLEQLAGEIEGLKGGMKNQGEQFLNLLQLQRKVDQITSKLPEDLRTEEKVSSILDRYGKSVDIGDAEFLTNKEHYLKEAEERGMKTGIEQEKANREALLDSEPGGGGHISLKPWKFGVSDKTLDDGIADLLNK